jgi:hypothetical protein
MFSFPGLLPPAVRGAIHNSLGALRLPGLSADETVVLLYALLWLLPVMLCARRIRAELAGELVQRYREGGTRWLFAGLMALGALFITLALYTLAAASVLAWGKPALLTTMPVTSLGLSACTRLWATLAPATALLRLAPAAALATALSAHVLAEAARWLSAHSLRAARNRRTRAVLAQLEAQLSQPDKPRGTIRYW